MARDELREALKVSASALAAAEVPFALGGSYALWVHGAPEPDNDVDLVITEPDVEKAAGVLAENGFEICRTPEDWLFKAVRGDALVDVLHRLNGIPVERAAIETAELADVYGVRVRALAPQAVVTAKLRALTEHYCDFAPLFPPVRAVREQIDWKQVAADVDGNPFAESFLLVLDRLGIIDAGIND